MPMTRNLLFSLSFFAISLFSFGQTVVTDNNIGTRSWTPPVGVNVVTAAEAEARAKAGERVVLVGVQLVTTMEEAAAAAAAIHHKQFQYCPLDNEQ